MKQNHETGAVRCELPNRPLQPASGAGRTVLMRGSHERRSRLSGGR
jgi:hypothetical protein